MGMWDEYCTVCGGPSEMYSDHEMDDEEGIHTPRWNPADYTWVESFVGISEEEELIPLRSYDSYGSFSIQPDTSPYSTFVLGWRNEYEDAITGYACHVTCYHLLQQELHYTLKYADVLPLLVDNDYCGVNAFGWSDYGGLAEYQGQDFKMHQLVKDGKVWMIEDPSRDGKNKERILQVWRPLLESGFKRPGAGRVEAELSVSMSGLELEPPQG